MDSIVSRLQERYEMVHELSTDFTQANFSKGMGESVTTSGKVYFKKPGMMRWEYDNPDGDLLVSDGTTIWLLQADLNQVVESSADVTGSTIARNFLAGIGSIRQDFDISLAGVTGESYRLDLSPKIDHPSIDRLSIDVDRVSFLIMGTTVLDRFGNETKIRFSGIQTDQRSQTISLHLHSAGGGDCGKTEVMGSLCVVRDVYCAIRHTHDSIHY